MADDPDRPCPLVQRGVRGGAVEAGTGVVKADAVGNREAERRLSDTVTPPDAQALQSNFQAMRDCMVGPD